MHCVCVVFFLNMIWVLFVSHFEFVIHLYSEFFAKNFTYNIVSILYSPLPPASCITLLVSLQLLGIYLRSLQLFCWFFCLFVSLLNFIYFWLLWVFDCCARLVSSCGEQRLPRVWCVGCSLGRLLELRRTGCGARRLQKLRPLGSGVWAQKFRCGGCVALRHVGSSRTRHWTRVSCVSRRLLYLWATPLEAPLLSI